MKFHQFWFILFVIVGMLAVFGGTSTSTQAQETSYPPLAEYIVFWVPPDQGPTSGFAAPGPCPASTEANPLDASVCVEVSAQAASTACALCAGSVASAPDARTNCSSIAALPPERLWADIQELQAQGHLELLEVRPEERGIRLQTDTVAAAHLAVHPDVDRLLLVRQVRRLDRDLTPPAPSAQEATVISSSATTERQKERSQFRHDGPVQLPVTSPNGLESDIPYYTWVNNQGANPAIAYNWVEISGTGTVVAQGDDVSTLVPLGFPFSFHGQTYSSAWVASNGYVGFGGAGSLSWLENMPLPAPTYPNNVIYGFWSYLTPTGGSNGNVYVQRIDATTFVIEWHQVEVWWNGQNVTFEIILNGADNSILLQYHTIGNSDTATVGIENESGTLATQYAYDTSGAIFNGLAIKFSPTHGTGHSIGGTVSDYDGTPVAGADVWAVSGQVTAYVRTDATGAYALSVIPGTHKVHAEKSGLFTTPERTVTVPPDQAGVDLVFPRRYTLSGLVRDFDGTGLSSLQISLSGGAIRTDTWTSQNGSYAFSVPAGTYEIKPRFRTLKTE